MTKYKWLNKNIQKCKNKFVETECPLLKDNQCSIYKTRPNCCKNYPQNNSYCSTADCLLIGKDKNTRESSIICARCDAKCCKRILIPKNQIITNEFILKWMNIDCQTCRKLFPQPFLHID